ncbi:MAG: hypothetical protein R6U58_09410 [Bacteroidales bacterium]
MKTGIMLISFFLLLFTVIQSGQEVLAQGPSSTDSPVAGMKIIQSDQGTVNTDDDLCSVNAIRRYLAEQISYPGDAVEAGHAGTVELYARINRQGNVNEILELQPVQDYVEVDKIVIAGYAPAGKEICESSRHSSLVAESRRVVMSLPKCDIQEIYGKTLKLTFRFVLQ